MRVDKISHDLYFVQIALLADLISEHFLLKRDRFDCVDLIITSTSYLSNNAERAFAK